jgi:hypothetical protein
MPTKSRFLYKQMKYVSINSISPRGHFQVQQVKFPIQEKNYFLRPKNFRILRGVELDNTRKQRPIEDKGDDDNVLPRFKIMN